MKLNIFAISCFTAFASLTSVAFADSTGWTSFRNGGPSQTAGENFPTSWSPEHNVAWQLETRGYGQSVPVIYDGHVFVTGVEGPAKETGLLIAFDLESGDIAWTHEFKTSQQSPSNYMNSRAAPSPVVDERAVYAFFETGDMFAVSHSGDVLWQRSLTEEFGPFQNHHGLGSSPAHTDELIVLNVEHDGPSYLIAFNKSDGETAWKMDRPSGKSWTSPIVVSCGQRDVVVVSSAGHVDAYNVENGEHLWNRDGLAGNTIPSPTAIGRNVLIGARIPEFGEESDAASSNMLLQLDESGAEAGVAWQADRAVCYYASPIAVGQFAYFVSKAGVAACLNASTGEMVYRKRLGMECWSTPVAVNNTIYFFGRNGESKVIRAGAEFEVLSENTLWPEVSPPIPLHYVEAVKGPSGHGSHGGHQSKGGHGDQAAHSDEKHAKKRDVESVATAEPTKASGHEDKHGHGNSHSHAPAKGGKPAGPPTGGFTARLMQGDQDSDGELTVDEVPDMLKGVFARLDKDGSGKLDAAELKSMEDEFRKKRENSRAESRDPIVYGVAAADDTFVIRTGTRLYAIRNAR